MHVLSGTMASVGQWRGRYVVFCSHAYLCYDRGFTRVSQASLLVVCLLAFQPHPDSGPGCASARCWLCRRLESRGNRLQMLDETSSEYVKQQDKVPRILEGRKKKPVCLMRSAYTMLKRSCRSAQRTEQSQATVGSGES